MRHEVWTLDFSLMTTIRKPQDWNFCRYCGKPIADTHNVPCCDSCYPAYHYAEQELYLHQHDVGGPERRFDPQTLFEGPETFHSEGWKYLDTTDGRQHVRDFVQPAI